MEIFKMPIRAILPLKTRLALRYKLYGLLFGRNLTRLAELFGTDKHGSHFYTSQYQKHFAHLRGRPLKLIEIGVGGWSQENGYNEPELGGESLRMWKAYFPKGEIFGIDIHDKSYHNESRIRTFQGSQDDEAFLQKVIAETGPPDIIIDDGSHYTNHVIRSFEILFPLLKMGGFYVIEDLQTSYWPSTDTDKWNGSEDLSAMHTSMNFFKRLVDGLNYEEFRHAHEPTYYDQNIIDMHFYHNLLFIRKGLNNEGSNMVGKGK